MPIVDKLTGHGLPIVYMNGAGDLSITGGVQSFFMITINAVSQTSFGGSLEIPSAIAIAGTSAIDLVGRVNGDANRFGQVAIAGLGDLLMNPRFVAAGQCIISAGATLAIRGRIAGGDASECKIFLSIVDPIDPGKSATYSARLIADSAEYKIRAFQYDESKQAVGISLNITLQKPTDRDAILAAESFQFDIYDNGSWQTLVSGGLLTGGGFSFAWQDGRPDDQLTITTAANISDKLGRTPDLNTTVYDSYREDIDASKFENLRDTAGHTYAHSLVAFPGMTLSTLFNWLFVTELGFTGVVTNLPNFPIRRVDFNMTQKFLDTLRGVIGNFDPLIFVQGTKVYILDSTLRLPAGMPTSIELDPDLYLNAQFSETELDADGFLVSYVEQDAEYDYQVTREIDIPTSTEGSPGSADYTETDITQTFTDFYKASDPSTPIRTEKTKEITTISGMVRAINGLLSLETISETTENITFDSKMRLQEISKSTVALIPDLTTPFNFISDFTRDEFQTFEYSPDIFDPRREYLSKMQKKVTALVATEHDPDKLNVGDTFKQEFFNAWRSGNFTDTMTIATEPVQLITETAFQTRKGQIEIRKRTVEYMTNPPAVINQVTDGRTGDISQNAASGSQREIIVLRDGLTTRAGRRLAPISVGEMPPKYFIPLMRRKLSLRKRRSGTVTTKGLMLSLVRGSAIGVLDHYGISAGNFLIEGRRIAGNNLGTRQQTTRQVLEVSQI